MFVIKHLEYDYCENCDRPIGAVGEGTCTKSGIGPLCEECLKEVFDLSLRKLGTDALHEFCVAQFEAHSQR